MTLVCNVETVQMTVSGASGKYIVSGCTLDVQSYLVMRSEDNGERVPVTICREKVYVPILELLDIQELNTVANQYIMTGDIAVQFHVHYGA